MSASPPVERCPLCGGEVRADLRHGTTPIVYTCSTCGASGTRTYWLAIVADVRADIAAASKGGKA